MVVPQLANTKRTIALGCTIRTFEEMTVNLLKPTPFEISCLLYQLSINSYTHIWCEIQPLNQDLLVGRAQTIYQNALGS